MSNVKKRKNFFMSNVKKRKNFVSFHSTFENAKKPFNPKIEKVKKSFFRRSKINKVKNFFFRNSKINKVSFLKKWNIDYWWSFYCMKFYKKFGTTKSKFLNFNLKNVQLYDFKNLKIFQKASVKQFLKNLIFNFQKIYPVNSLLVFDYPVHEFYQNAFFCSWLNQLTYLFQF